jgi:GH15 family glucan-1,4-alpha-glucosidase
MKKQKIKELIKISKEIIDDGSLENGAIVAANSDKAIYPATTQDYRYVWVRDAAYVCMAADLLRLRDIPERFFDWCLNRAEDFKETGFFSNAYNVNGTIHGTLFPLDRSRIPRHQRESCIDLIHSGTQFQPDQGGSLLIAIAHHKKHFNTDVTKFEKLINKTASGICQAWKGDSFVLPCYDLWEERCILPKHRGFHTYSLAMCIAGLRAAIEMLGKKRKWLKTKKEMLQAFEYVYSSSTKSIPRIYRNSTTAKNRKIRVDDSTPDTSLLGLVYPSGILEPLDDKMKTTVLEIIKMNTKKDGGLLRYPGDIYCGEVRRGWVTLTGAGTWPLLSFWMSIYYSMCGDDKNAEKFFEQPLERIDKYMPEQIFDDRSRKSISPLIWSHAMFVIAAKFLGHI